jgi:hypothetical protein
MTFDQTNFLDKHVIGSWILNSERLVDVNGSFNCSQGNYENFLEIKFGSVSENFIFSNNQLTTLEGAPESVGKGFYCSGNNLTSLEGAPKSVGGNFICYNNRLTSLKGAPDNVGGSFRCSNNKLTSLEGAPESVGGFFRCDDFQIQKGKWGPKSWLDTALNVSKLAVTLLTDPAEQKKITDQANSELKKKGNFEEWEVIFKFPWYKPTPFVEALYKTWKKGL